MKWFKHGFWNTLEHALTRGADAATSLVLLWALPPENFSKLALAQAWVAPALFAFVSPESVIYRDFARWKGEGPGFLAARLRALRLFSWGKGQLALLLALAAALLYPGNESWWGRFYALLWAFALALGPQLTGGDREFLRLDLRLRELNAISLYQKATLLGGTVAAALLFPGRIGFLAAAAVFSVVSSAAVAHWRVRGVLRELGVDREGLRGRRGPPPFETLNDSLRTFSLYSHVLGVVSNWILTMDVFFLGVFRYSAREVGLYAATLKLANFSQALPLALSNLFSVKIGREAAGERGAELSLLGRATLWMGLLSLVQGAVLFAVSPWIFARLSHGRWTPDEQSRMVGWLFWILLGAVLLTNTYLASAWLLIRGRIERLFAGVSLPWLGLSLAAYAAAAHYGGPAAVAKTNVAVALGCLGLLGRELWLVTR